MTLDIEKDLIKEFGDIIHDASFITNNPPPIISISPKIDIALGGGVPEGSVFILTGPSKAGKTVVSLTLAANAQKLTQSRNKIYYANVEGRIKKRDLEGICGLNLDPSVFTTIGSSMGNIISGEKYLISVEKILKTIPHSVCIVDSFSALSAESELTSELTDAQVMAIQKTLAKFLRRVCNVLPVNRSTLVGITHLMANISSFGKGKKTVEKSGTSLKYHADVKLHASHFEPIMQGDTQIGQKVHWKVEFSAIGPPGQKVTSYIKYGRGIWKEYEVAELAKDFGLISAGGSWITLQSGEKVQGMSNLATMLEENPNMYEDMKQSVFEMVGLANEGERFVEQPVSSEDSGESNKSKRAKTKITTT